jgi:hypothetical protein
MSHTDRLDNDSPEVSHVPFLLLGVSFFLALQFTPVLCSSLAM